MTPGLALEFRDFEARTVSHLREMGAYEALWDEQGATFKTISEKFSSASSRIAL